MVLADRPYTYGGPAGPVEGDGEGGRPAGVPPRPVQIDRHTPEAGAARLDARPVKRSNDPVLT